MEYYLTIKNHQLSYSYMEESEKHYAEQKSQIQKTAYCEILIIWNSRIKKKSTVTERIASVPGHEERRISAKEHKGNLRGEEDGNVLYLDYGSGYKGLYICQYSYNYPFNMVAF